MDISDNLLAAYAKGKVSESERNAVRQYLMHHPERLKDILLMMDDDADINREENKSVSIFSDIKSKAFSKLCYSAAAFAPMNATMVHNIESPGHVDSKTLDERLDDLLDELEI